MNNNLNLASKPFNNRFLPWALACLLLLVAMVGLVYIVKGTSEARQQASSLQAETTALKQREQSLLKNAEQVKEELTPDQRLALPAAHRLVDRKQFSWSHLLADMEATLPDNVRVTRIAIRNVTKVGDQTVAEFDLAVFTKSATTITQMMSDMTEAGVFKPVLRSQNLAKGRGEAGTEYELEVVYQPRAGFATERMAEISETKPSGQPR